MEVGAMQTDSMREHEAGAGWVGFDGAFREACAGAGEADGARGERMCGDWVETPVGPVVVVASEAGVRALEFGATATVGAVLERVRARWRGPIVLERNFMLDAAVRELAEYFAGARCRFDVAVDPGGTEFQRRVWGALVRIPVGETRSYAEIAGEVGSPGALRAVGRTNGMNPVAIIVPCHRVIGADGSLTGFGGGLWRKRWLLDHEARMTGRVVGGQLMLAE
jgi:AraC family transcriptional regulator of adaptative response/methylated-DNA-[protein]-cysteine methyltransferase